MQVVVRLLIPSIILRTANAKLGSLPGYTGHVQDVDLFIIKGYYVIQGISLSKIEEPVKTNTSDTIPFFDCNSIALSLDWGKLFKGALVGRITIDKPILTIAIKEIKKEKVKKVKEDTTKFNELIENFMPLKINRFEIHNGEVHYADLKKKPVIDVSILNIEVTATNLSNVDSSIALLPARLKVSATIYEGKFDMDVNFNLLKDHPTFDMKMQVRKLNLVLLNKFFRTNGNFDIQRGFFNLYSEVAAKDGKFGGYIKPFIEEFKVKKYNDKEDFKEILWESIIGTTMNILENKKTDEVATKVPFNGSFNQPDINFWKAINYVLRNAFINALRPALDNSINVYKLADEKNKTFLEKIFKKNKK